MEITQQRHRLLSCGDLEMDLDARLVRVSGREVPLTYVEFELLHRMLRDPGRVFTRPQLLITGAAPSSSTVRSVDIHISRLRKKMLCAESFAIETVPHVGYRCRDRSTVSEPRVAALS